ncbi:hypothetical protein CYLTODRAFT_425589 [Cylindrobasidium torrendii FP15055 ss-10]|uniref:CsbD-like domain-containing protein n=1 Tax=Cylindrobasidium torrendii FP15055 ss-10 TaxID=1314674 RepID=A0A0D7B3A5_9AGAR|nr:hypothetical protein CYLTODRAFT_425589 [Cylindrobasidium torrendii FP15055 ss-10]
MSPSKTSGQFHSVKGDLKQSLGGAFHDHSMQAEGKQEHVAGKVEYDAARAEGYAEGTKDRVVGTKDSVLGALTGNASKQSSGNAQRNGGELRQTFNKKI